MNIFIFSIADGTAKLLGRDREILESTVRRYDPGGSEDLQKNSDRSQPADTKEDAEARNDFWSIEGDFIYRHHVEHRVHLYVPEEELLPIPLNYVDVTRITHTNLDVMQAKRINDCGNVDGDRTLSDSLTGFTKFTFFE